MIGTVSTLKYSPANWIVMLDIRGAGVSILGIAGGILGLLMGIVAFIAGGIGALIHISGAYGFFLSSWIAVFLSLLGMAGAYFTRFEALPGGVAVAVAGSLGIYILGGFFIIPSAIMIIAGVIAIVDSFRRWNVRTV